MQRMMKYLGLLAASFVMVSSVASAQPLDEGEVPEPLRAWVPWVLAEEPEYGCTFVGAERVCTWPGAVSLVLDESGGRFEMTVVADRETVAWLPGSDEHFPRDVRVDGAPHPVLPHQAPGVRLEPGTHRIEGAFEWRDMPDILAVPPEIARVSLVLSGASVRSPRREDTGAVWLARPSEGTASEGHFEMEVFRRLDDGVPFRVITHVAIRASGEPREMVLGNVLLDDMVPTSVDSDLAVRLQPDGTLAAQIHAGSFAIEIASAVATPPDALSPPAQEEPWPPRETWVWVAAESERQVELGGAPSVDPARTNLPAAWRSHPAYALSPEHTLELSTLRRGEPSPPPTHLSLSREMWLDLDGEGYTVRDQVSGRMTERFRLDLEEGDLGHVVVGGNDQLVTTLDDTDGVELRQRAVDLRAEWRLPGATSDVPAVAWSEDVQELSATVHLPPGYTLLAATGVDEARGTWVEQWDLWGLFFVVLLSLAIGRLYGWRWGAVALPMLALCYHEVGAPLWSWALLAAIAGLRVAWTRGKRAPRVLRVLYWGALAVVVLVAVPFAADQIRFALFPQTDSHLRSFGFAMHDAPALVLATGEEERARNADGTEGMMGGDQDVPAAATAQEPVDGHLMPAEEPMLEQAGQTESETTARQLDYADALAESDDRYVTGTLGSSGLRRGAGAFRQGWIDPNEKIQTGPGVPDWSFRSWHLSWSGPVAEDHRLRLWVVSPLSNRLLALLRVGLLGVLLLVVARRRFPKAKPPAAPAGGKGTAAAAAGLLVLGVLGGVSQVEAQQPDDHRLEQLRERLTRSPECVPSCVVASELEVRVRDDRAVLEAVVHASARAAYRVPGPADAWVPDTVTVDGQPASGLARLEGGFLFLRLEPGVHRVRMEGPIPLRDALTLAFGEPPRSVDVDAPGWEVEGVRADGRVAESIQLRRTIRAGEGDRAEQLALEPWLAVTRRLDVGVRWTMHSTVERVTPTGKAVVVRIPLLEGESVTDPGVITEGGEVVVTLGRDATATSWTSVIEPREELVLEAPSDVRWSETWTLACSPIWRCEAEGQAPVSHESAGMWEPTYRPWPGEELTLSFSRPEAAEGQSVTVDRATLVWEPGVRMLAGTLDATIRASSGGAQTMVLPEGARVQTLTIDGVARPVQLEGRELRMTLSPGSQQVHVEWQQSSELGPVFDPPEVRLGAAAVNARVEVRLPRDRWLLWANGPDWGAAVLFWPYLLLVLVIAAVLARTRRSPLRAWDWALLGLGLTQIPAIAALLVVGWFFAMEHRARTPDRSPGRFDARQIVLAGYTFVAAGCLYAAVHAGLLMQPDMEVFTPGGGGAHRLDWYQDRTGGAMPDVWLLTLPTWVWRLVMLGWALWLAMRVISWSRWAWRSFSEGGLWKKPMPPRRPVAAATGAETAAPAASVRAQSTADASRPDDAGTEDDRGEST